MLSRKFITEQGITTVEESTEGSTNRKRLRTISLRYYGLFSQVTIMVIDQVILRYLNNFVISFEIKLNKTFGGDCAFCTEELHQDFSRILFQSSNHSVFIFFMIFKPCLYVA